MSTESALQALDDVVAEMRAELRLANKARDQAEEDREKLWQELTRKDQLIEQLIQVVATAHANRDALLSRLALISSLAEDYCDETSTIPMGAAAVRLRLDLQVALNPDRETYPLAAGDADDGDEDTWTPVGTINDGRWTVYTHDYSHTLKVIDNRTGEPVSTDSERFTFGDDGNEDVVQDWLERKTYDLTPIDEPVCVAAR